MPSADVRARREAVVREHMASENVRDFDATIATFGLSHPLTIGRALAKRVSRARS